MNVGQLKEIIKDMPDDMKIFGAYTSEWDISNLFPLVNAVKEDIFPNINSKLQYVLKLELSVL